MSTPEWLATNSIPELETTLAKINAKIEELKAVDWTTRIANAVRRDQATAHKVVEQERDAVDDLRLAEGRKIACEQRIAEVREAERDAKLKQIRGNHAKALVDCAAALKAGRSAFAALVKAIDSYDAARTLAGRSVADEFDLLDFAEGYNPNELVLSKLGQAGLAVPISRELAELGGSLAAIATRARWMTDRPPVGRILAPSIEITGGSK